MIEHWCDRYHYYELNTTVCTRACQVTCIERLTPAFWSITCKLSIATRLNVFLRCIFYSDKNDEILGFWHNSGKTQVSNWRLISPHRFPPWRGSEDNMSPRERKSGEIIIRSRHPETWQPYVLSSCYSSTSPTESQSVTLKNRGPIYKESYDKLTTNCKLRTSYDKRLIYKETYDKDTNILW